MLPVRSIIALKKMGIPHRMWAEDSLAVRMGQPAFVAHPTSYFFVARRQGVRARPKTQVVPSCVFGVQYP